MKKVKENIVKFWKYFVGKHDNPRHVKPTLDTEKEEAAIEAAELTEIERSIVQSKAKASHKSNNGQKRRTRKKVSKQA